MRLWLWLARKIAAVSFAVVAVLLLAGFDADKTSRSVYRILTLEQRNIGFGSGFLVSGRRFVVTNNHVVEAKGPATVVIAFMLQNREVVIRARVVKRNPEKDLALLEAEEDLPGEPLTLGNYEPEKATDVFAIGFPGAADLGNHITADSQGRLVFPGSYFNATVTRGVISRFLRQPGLLGGGAVVQHTSPIAPGNSGGPLFDNCNNVIGVNTLSSKEAANFYWGPAGIEVADYIRPEVTDARTTSVKCLINAADTAERLYKIYALAGGTLLLAMGALVVAFRRRPAVKAPLTFVRERVASALRKQANPMTPAARPTAAPAPARQMRLVPLTAGFGPIDLPAARLASGGAVRVGRGSDVECTISHDTVSKVHARIYADAGQRVWLEDMGSSNGTYVNGQRVSKAELSPRQTVKFGEVEYRFES